MNRTAETEAVGGESGRTAYDDLVALSEKATQGFLIVRSDDDWGVVRSELKSPDDWQEIVFVARGWDDQEELAAAREQKRQPKRSGANRDFLIALVNAFRRGDLVPPPEAACEEKVRVDYTNHRGERGVRTITPWSVEWGTNQYHPVPQWLLTCLDHDKHACRVYALRDIHAWNGVPTESPVALAARPPAPQPAAREAVIEALRGIVEFCDDPNGSERGVSLALGLSELLPAARAALTPGAPATPTDALDIAEALSIVIALAKNSAMGNFSEKYPELRKQSERQREAINMIEDLAVNQFGDD